MNIDAIVEKRTKPLAEAVARESRANGFVPPGLYMRKITAAVTGIGIALSDVSFVTQVYLSKSKFPQAFGMSENDSSMLLDNCEKNAQYIAGMSEKLVKCMDDFTASEEKFRESDFQFFLISHDGMADSLKFLNTVGKCAIDPEIAAEIREVVSRAAPIIIQLNEFVQRNYGKGLTGVR